MRHRIHERELIDADRQDVDELARSLHQVAQVNRFLGGTLALRRHLAPYVAAHRGLATDLTLLDVGTGDGEVAARLEAWMLARGARCRVVGLDAHEDVVRVAGLRAAARGGRPVLVRGDALALPFPDRAFDVACCTLTLHHFADRDAALLVAEMARVARLGVVVNDLERSRLNYWAARLLSRTWWRSNRLTRNDGPLSVLRSFTPDELRRIGGDAGLVGVVVRRHFPFRLVLEGRDRCGDSHRAAGAAGSPD